jgi:hypothetical protein
VNGSVWACPPKLMKSLQKSPPRRRNFVQSLAVLATDFANGLFNNQGDTTMAVLQDLSKTNGKAPAAADLMAQIEALKAENAKLKEARNAKISFKVSEKGAVSVYGMGRFPVTLYSGQWQRLIEVIPQLQAFMAENVSKLAVKE